MILSHESMVENKCMGALSSDYPYGKRLRYIGH